MTLSLTESIAAVGNGEHLSAARTAEAFGAIMRGEATHEQIRDLLLGLKAKGETADEVAGAAQALRSAMIHLPPVPRGTYHVPLVDTCGTGGGTVTTFNISTTAAFVVAGAGVPVAKHGNRSFTSRSGSADVLEALGIDIALTPDRAGQVLAEVGLVFLFAPTYHPAMRHAAPVRKELKTATIFNLLGPLANPAGVTRQVIGVHDAERGPLVAAALGRLGAEHALVVHAEVGMDEIAPAGVTRVWEVGGPQATGHGPREWTLDPREFDLAHDDLESLRGGEPAENGERMLRLLDGERGDEAARSAVILNAAAAVYVSGRVGSFREGVDVAHESIASASGIDVFHALKKGAR